MNFQLHDILSNPSLLNHVPEETLQGWIKQYPYVALFQLYALKRKPDYTETDLHHTAFYFHNREKLYFLLNNKNQRVATPVTTYKAAAETEAPAEAAVVENKVEHIVLAESLPLSISVPVEFEEKEQDIFPEDFSQQIPQEEIHHESLVKEKPSDEKQIINEPQEEEIVLENDTMISGTWSVEKADDKPLSIAEQVIAEIKKIQEERAQRKLEEQEAELNGSAAQNGFHVEQKIEAPEIPYEEKEVEEEIVEAPELSESTEEEVSDIPSTAGDNQEEEKEEHIPVDQPEVEEAYGKTAEDIAANVAEIVTPVETEIQEEISEVNEQETENETEAASEIEEIAEIEKNESPTPEQTETEESETPALETKEEISHEEKASPSIADMVIAAIHRIKEFRARRSESERESEGEDETAKETVSEKVSEETQSDPIGDLIPYPVNEQVKETELIEDTVAKQSEGESESESEGEKETEETSNETEPKTEDTEEVPTVTEEKNEDEQEEAIQQSEREMSKAEDIPVHETEKHNEVKVEEEKVQPEEKTEEHEAEKPVAAEKEKEETKEEDTAHDDKQPSEESAEKETEQETEKEEDAHVHDPIHTNIEEEKAEEAVTETKGEDKQEEEISESKKEMAATEDVPETAIKAADQEKPEEKEEKKEPVSTVAAAQETTVKPEEKVELAFEIEKTLHEPAVKHLDEKSKKEPHTFIEWLQFLDGSLQVQTTEARKEKEWIEVPQYEVAMQQQIRKEEKKAETPPENIRQQPAFKPEEKKLFEPNFEEGEVDLFNEIDEEVTKVASESVSFKEDMMTETLAKIYTKQGKKDKALEIYNALRLKFPEKSGYFAALIQKLEKEE